jgi:hypothetical protein
MKHSEFRRLVNTLVKEELTNEGFLDKLLDPNKTKIVPGKAVAFQEVENFIKSMMDKHKIKREDAIDTIKNTLDQL